MPISRYQIRNPYGLADPDLYRSADRDDPEAILEGVAMAGLVGILRQLGDLAEFAAEIFRDLHEDVMATAARGHGLMIRVQQVEAEFPSIERAFLSQTIHSNFAKNAGVEWHANLKMELNLLTTGDMQRFIMDSYEECRGPPRLFLLDKFDIAGSGACLKRYSDPSFFKTEFFHSKRKKAEVQREAKARKIKKRGACWRNGDTSEMFSTHFNSTLRQLFSDENESDSKKVPIHAVKLKRKHLNGSSFNSITGRSYMECVLETCFPKHAIVHENSECNMSDLAFEIHQISKVDFASKLQMDRNWISSPNGQEVLKSFLHELDQDIVKEQSLESLHKPTARFHEEILSSTRPQISQNYVTDDDERRMEARETEVEEISSAIRQADEKHESLNEKSKIEDDVSKTESDKLAPSYLHVGQKGALFDIESRIEICLDGYRSAEPEEEKNTTIYPEDQRDAFDGKNKAEVIDDGYGTDNVARNSSFIHPIDQKELPDGNSKTEFNDDVYGSDNAEKNHAVIYTTDHDVYEFYDAEKNHSGICPVDQKDSLLNGESKPQTSDDGHGSNDAASELDNYMDALTTMESEMETDMESRAKHEKTFLDVVTTETYYDMNEKRYDVHPDVHPVEDSSTSYDLNGSCKKQRFSCSDSSTNLADDVQILEGKGIASLDGNKKFNKSPKFEDAMPGPINRSSSFVLPDKSTSPSNGDAGAEAYLSPNIDLTEVHDATPDELTSCDDPGTKSPQSFIPSSNNYRISEISHFVSVSGEISWSSCITDAGATLIHSSSGASLNEVQLVATDPSEISSVNIEAMGNHSGDDILLIPEVSSRCPQMEDLATATFAKSSTTSRMLDSEDHNASSESGLYFSDILNMPQRMKDAEEDCSGAAGLTSGHLDMTLGDLQATFESHLPLQTPESADHEKDLTNDSSTASVGENLIMLDLPSLKTSPVEDQLLSLAKCDIDACTAILLPPECLAHVRTDPIDASPCGLNSEKESTGRHSSCAVGLPNSIELPEHEQTSDILPYMSENSNMKSHNNILDQADACAVSIETETSLFSGWERLCGAPENEVTVVPVNLPLKSPVDDLPVEFSVHSDDMANRSAVGLSICNDDGPTIDSRAPSDHPRLLEEESLPTEVSLHEHKIEMSEPPNQEDNIAFNGQNLTALSDNEANELLMHATDPAATAEPCQPDSQDLVVSEFLDGVHHTMPLQGTIIHPHSSDVLDVPLLSRGGSQDLEQKLRESNQPVGPKSPDLCHPCKDEKDAVSPSTHFISEPSIPPEQILDAISSHDKECLEPADHLFERKKSLEEMVPPVMYEADCFNSHPDSSLVDQLIQQLSESKLKPESLVVATSSIMNEPAISSLGVPRSTILKSEAQMQLPPSHCHQTSESPTNLLNSTVASTPSLTSPSIGMLISEKAHELQPNMPILGFPLSEPNFRSHEMEDMPPLPPLPPIEWRIGKLRHNSLPYGGQTMHSTDPFLIPQINRVDRTQQHPNPFLGPQTVDTDNSKQLLSPFGLIPTREEEKNQGGSLGSITVQPPNSYFPLPNTDNKKSLLSSQPVEEVRKHPPNPSMLSVIVEDEKCPHDLQTSEDPMLQSVIPLMPPETKEDQKANDKMQSEHTRPRDPLIEAVAAHDRSMLRKVSKRFQNETMPKLDERDSLLGQIRAKSFNLKPTTSVKPIIQGPRTNLNVVAILEKANAIRQAFAGSDEDNDSDSWSDS